MYFLWLSLFPQPNGKKMEEKKQQSWDSLYTLSTIVPLVRERDSSPSETEVLSCHYGTVASGLEPAWGQGQERKKPSRFAYSVYFIDALLLTLQTRERVLLLKLFFVHAGVRFWDLGCLWVQAKKLKKKQETYCQVAHTPSRAFLFQSPCYHIFFRTSASCSISSVQRF